MAKKSKKKKKQHKKQHFVSSSQATQTSAEEKVISKSTKTSAKVASAPVKTESQSVHDTHQQLVQKVLKKEARVTALIGGSITVVLFVLWFLFEHTGLGDAVYRLIKV